MTREMRPIILEEIESRMSPAQRARVDKLTAKMRAEEMSLAQIRKARALTQSALAHRLGKSQALVSHIESAGDLFISTLRKQVEALGGELDIRANFPDMPTVSIGGFIGIAERASPGSQFTAMKKDHGAKPKSVKAAKRVKVFAARHGRAGSAKGTTPARIAAKSL